MDKKGHLNLRQVPEDLLPALEQHLNEMDSIRKSANPAKPRYVEVWPQTRSFVFFPVCLLKEHSSFRVA